MAQIRRTHAERRPEIADAALRLIATRGVHELTVASLARELGLTGGALYRHFESTAEILEVAAARIAELLAATLPDPALPPLEWLEAFVRSRAKAVGGQAGVGRLLMSEQFALAMPKRALESLRGAVRQTVQAVSATIARGQAAGVIRRDLEALALVPVVLGAVQVLALAQSSAFQTRLTDPERTWSTLETLIAPPRSPR